MFTVRASSLNKKQQRLRYLSKSAGGLHKAFAISPSPQHKLS